MTALYASPPVLKDRSFELTALGPYILAWQDELEYRQLAQKTRDNYEQDLAIVARAYPTKTPGDFTPKDVMDACNLFPLKRGPAPTGPHAKPTDFRGR